MPDTPKTPIGRLEGVTPPGSARPVATEAMQEEVSILRQVAGAQAWQKLPGRPGTELFEGDVVRLHGPAYTALGARAFTVEQGLIADPFLSEPRHLHVVAHEATHVAQQRPPNLAPLNDAVAEQIERQAEGIEEMVLHKAPPGR